MPTDELRLIMQICIERAETEPLIMRVFIYRALAHFCGNEQQSAEFNQIADSLALADAKLGQLSLFWDGDAGTKGAEMGGEHGTN